MKNLIKYKKSSKKCKNQDKDKKLNSFSDASGHYDLDGVSLDPSLGVVVSSSKPGIKKK